MPRLRQLDAEFIRLTSDGGSFEFVDAVNAAQGIMFLCPVCFTKNGGAAGTHMMICWFRDRGVPDSMNPGPGRWTPQGAGLDDLSFVPGHPPMACSVLLGSEGGGCGWHGFIRNGEATLS